MGKDARAKQAAIQAASIVLEAADFWQLRARIRDTEIAKAEAERTVRAVLEQQGACFAAIATKYGFDPALSYRWDDTTCTLIPIDTSPKETM